jgi:hypothetical protein
VSEPTPEPGAVDPVPATPLAAPGRRRRVSAPLVVMALLVAGAVTYCSATGFFSSTGVSPCFTALPVAKAAIHVKARFVGVQRLGIKDLQEDFPVLSQRMPELGKKPACVVAYQGNFLPGDVVNPRPPDRGGRIALVIVPDRAKQAAATLLRDHVPAHFRQLFGRGPHR